MRKINGYIELDGSIQRIGSIEDLKRIVNELGESFTDLTEMELKELTEKYLPDGYEDDCGCKYSENQLWSVVNATNKYKVQEGTKVIHRSAFYYNNYNRSKERYRKESIENILLPQSLIAIGQKAFRYNIFKNISCLILYSTLVMKHLWIATIGNVSVYHFLWICALWEQEPLETAVKSKQLSSTRILR